MENPMSRPEAAEVIDDALREHEAAVKLGVAGFSACMYVWAALKQRGFLREGA